MTSLGPMNPISTEDLRGLSAEVDEAYLAYLTLPICMRVRVRSCTHVVHCEVPWDVWEAQ